MSLSLGGIGYDWFVSFTIEDAEDLIQLLREHPEWKARVRGEVLGEELLTLPELVRQNSVDIRDLQEVVRQNSADIRQNSVDIRDLQEIVRQNSADIRGLQALIKRISDAIDQLILVVEVHERRLTRIDGRLGDMSGWIYEARWRMQFSGRLGTLIRRARLVTPRDLSLFETADESESISEADALAVRQADLLVEGKMGRGDTLRNVLLVVEVSTTVESSDVARAIARADILKRLGYDTIPVVGGARMDAGLYDEAISRGVRVLLNPDDIGSWAKDVPIAG